MKKHCFWITLIMLCVFYKHIKMYGISSDELATLLIIILLIMIFLWWVYGRKILRYAIENDYILLSKILIFLGAGVNAKTNSGKTTLMIAVRKGDINLVRLLLEGGADVNAQNNKDNTALYYAMCDNNVNVAQLLINRGADVNAEDCFGHRILYNYVVTGHNNKEIIDLLLKYGAYKGDIELAIREQQREQEREREARKREWEAKTDPNGYFETDNGSIIHYKHIQGLMVERYDYDYWHKKYVVIVGGQKMYVTEDFYNEIKRNYDIWLRAQK